MECAKKNLTQVDVGYSINAIGFNDNQKDIIKEVVPVRRWKYELLCLKLVLCKKQIRYSRVSRRSVNESSPLPQS